LLGDRHSARESGGDETDHDITTPHGVSSVSSCPMAVWRRLSNLPENVTRSVVRRARSDEVVEPRFRE
jgi:hypothetical protein